MNFMPHCWFPYICVNSLTSWLSSLLFEFCHIEAWKADLSKKLNWSWNFMRNFCTCQGFRAFQLAVSEDISVRSINPLEVELASKCFRIFDLFLNFFFSKTYQRRSLISNCKIFASGRSHQHHGVRIYQFFLRCFCYDKIGVIFRLQAIKNCAN